MLGDSFLYGYPGVYQFVFDRKDGRDILDKTLKREEVTIFPKSVFIDHGYL